MNAYDKLMKGDEKPKGNSAEDVTAAINAALEPLVSKFDALEAKVTANEQAEKTAHVNTVVEAGLLAKEDAEKLDSGVLAKMAANCKQSSGGASFLNTNFASGGEKEFADDMPE
jgi:hypothetical protein